MHTNILVIEVTEGVRNGLISEMRDFACGRCKKQVGLVELVEELCEEVEMVRGFCYLGDRVNASGG